VLAARYAIPRQQGRDLGGSLNLNLLVSRGRDQLAAPGAGRRRVRPSLEAMQQARRRLDDAGAR